MVFFDFDNTIATRDTFDGMLPLFSQDRRWMALEEEWKKGKISSRECLAGQLAGLRLAREKLDRYLRGVKLDPYFKGLLGLLRRKKIKTVVLSDNFDYILKAVFKNHAVRNLKVYCNKLGFKNNRPIPSFPFTNSRCRLCGHCKTKNLLLEAGKNAPIVYIGDGHSDSCPVKYAHVVFAKDDLRHFCEKRKINFFAYRNFRDIYHYFERSL